MTECDENGNNHSMYYYVQRKTRDNSQLMKMNTPEKLFSSRAEVFEVEDIAHKILLSCESFNSSTHTPKSATQFVTNISIMYEIWQ